MSTESTYIRTKRDAVIVISDSGAAHTYTVAYEEGNFQFDVPRETVEMYLDRGLMASSIGGTPSIRKGDEQPMTLSFSAYFRDAGSTDATATGHATLLDILHRYASGFIATQWTSTLGANSDEFTFTVAVTLDGTIFGEADKTLTFKFVSLRGGAAEGSPNTVSAAGTAYHLVPTLS